MDDTSDIVRALLASDIAAVRYKVHVNVLGDDPTSPQLSALQRNPPIS